MIEIIPAPGHVGAYRLSGTLTEEDYDQVITDIEAKLARYEKIGICVDLTGFHDLTIRAGLKDLRYSFGRIFDWHRFPREAIITDRHWIRMAVTFMGPLIPFVALRLFDPGEDAEALAWAGEVTPVERPQKAPAETG